MKMKDEFLATITHEFKTPLTVINAALQIIESLYGSQIQDNVKKHLQRIRTNSFRQLRLVNNLLDITRFNSGHFKIQNPLSNAIKFTPKGKSINVNVFCNTRNAIITVKDEGVGIPKAKQKLIFERFGQVDNSLTRQAEGTGIGLSLVKTLVKGMNGQIKVNSNVGMGSAFRVILPITKLRRKETEFNLNDCPDHRIMQAAAIEFSDIYVE